MPRQLPVGFYVYAYYFQLGTEPFYIGKGIGKRAWSHLCPSHYLRQSRFHNKVASLLSLGESPEIEIVEDALSEEDAFLLEKRLISLYGRMDLGLGPLLNVTDGGEGYTGNVQSKAQRDKTSILTTIRNKGNKYGIGRIDPRRKAIVGRSLSSEFNRCYPSVKAVEKDGYHRITIQKALRTDGFAYNLLWSYVS